MKIVAFDPALSCGWCISSLDTNSGTVTLLENGYIVTEKSEYVGDMCLEFQKAALNIIEKYDDICEIVMEDYMFSKSKCQGAQLNVFLRGALMMLCRQLNKPYWIMSVSNWKSIIAGRSMPTRECVKYYGKALANKIFIQEALWLRYNVRFPNHSISHKTGKPISLKYDIVDATGINIAHVYANHNIKVVCNDISNSPDVSMKCNKKMYSYTEI